MTFTFSEAVEELVPSTTRKVIGVTDVEAFLVRNAGDTVDTFKVNTTDDEVELATSTALCWGDDLMLWRDGPNILAQRNGLNDQFFYVYAEWTDASNYERLAIYAGSDGEHFIETQTAGTGADNVNLTLRSAGSGTIRFSRGGSELITFSATAFNPGGPGISLGGGGGNPFDDGNFGGNLRVGVLQTSAGFGITLDAPDLTGAGTRDSHAILWTGQAFDASAHDSDVQMFVNPTANDGTHEFLMQTRIDASAWTTRLSFNSDGVVEVPGTLQGENAAAYTCLNEASTTTNPTLIPRRDALGTGIGGFPEMGDPGLSLIVDSVEQLRIRQDVMTFQSTLSSVNCDTILHVRGDADNLTFLVRGHTTQNDDLIRAERNNGDDTLTLNNDGDLVVSGGVSVSNLAEGGTGKVERTTAREAHTLSLAATSVTTTLAIPAGARLIGASFNVNTAVTDDAGDDTWSAAFSGGSTTALATAAAAAQDTKVDTLIVDEITSGVTEITFTPNGGNFSAGVIEVVVYYEVLTSLANV